MRQTSIAAFVGVLVALCLASATQAQIVLSDNFNAENGGVGVLNYAGFANWNVTQGTVDLIGNGYYDFQPGNGLYVDMDGSTDDAGTLTSKSAFSAGTYRLTFDLAGNLRGGTPEPVAVTLDMGGTPITTLNPSASDPFTAYTYTFTTTASGHLQFACTGGDNVGPLLDNVVLTEVPEPSSLLLLLPGLVPLGLLLRRRA